MVETFSKTNPENQSSDQNKQDLFTGFVSQSKLWEDTPEFEYSSSSGFKTPEGGDHKNPILIVFSKELVGTDARIRHIRQKTDGRITASVVIIEHEDMVPPEGKPVQNYPLQTRENLQNLFDEHVVPYGVRRVFRRTHENHDPENRSKLEYLVYEMRMRDTDPAYIDLAIQGNEEAFTAIYSDFRERIRKYAAGILSRAGYGDNRWIGAEDIAQETFERAFNARNRFKKYTNVPIASWLFTIASNVTTTHLRRGHYTQISAEPAKIEQKAGIQKGHEDLSLELQVVGQLMGKLPPRQQQALALSSLGYNDTETAWVLGFPSIEALKGSRHKGRVELAKVKPHRQERQIGQYYLITLAHKLLVSKITRGRNFWKENQLKASVLQSLHTAGFQDTQINAALSRLPEDFFDRLAQVHTVPR